MHFLDLTLPSAAENLALDEALLLEAEAGGPEVLRLWELPYLAVVVGAGGKLAEEVDAEACARANVPVLRRSSGGGSVLLGPGCLAYSLVLSFEREPALCDIRSSYCFILRKLAAVLSTREVRVHPAGTSDLALSDRKVSGNSQQRKRTHLLHHGTLLYGFPTNTLGLYLRPPPRQPEYRSGRSHDDFVTNLPYRREFLSEVLKRDWNAKDTLAWPRELVTRLNEEKYSRPEWTHRR